jgi:hypothetical protein
MGLTRGKHSGDTAETQRRHRDNEVARMDGPGKGKTRESSGRGAKEQDTGYRPWAAATITVTAAAAAAAAATRDTSNHQQLRQWPAGFMMQGDPPGGGGGLGCPNTDRVCVLQDWRFARLSYLLQAWRADHGLVGARDNEPYQRGGVGFYSAIRR